MPIKFLKCKRCGRELKDPSSQLVGYGPTCIKKLHNDSNIQLDLFSFEEANHGNNNNNPISN